QAAHRQSRHGKGVSPNANHRQAQLQAQTTDFVLEKVLERLDQLEAELFGQSVDVVVRLDGGRRPVDGSAALNDVGVERPLGQEPGVVDVQGLIFEDVNENVADDAALFLRIA